MLEYRDRYLILSASGRGYHVFILANEPRPVGEWAKLLKDTADIIGAPIQDGVCEMFPNEKTAKQEFGRGIRVPSSLNPSTDEVELILADTIRPLLDHLVREAAKNGATRRSYSSAPKHHFRDAWRSIRANQEKRRTLSVECSLSCEQNHNAKRSFCVDLSLSSRPNFY